VIQVQEYDLHIRHIKDTSNFLADTISCNPAGLSEREIKELSMPRGMMVAAIDLGVDPTVRRNLRDLAIHKARGPKLLKLIQAVKKQQTREVLST
jgi:hypothetical protein